MLIDVVNIYSLIIPLLTTLSGIITKLGTIVSHHTVPWVNGEIRHVGLFVFGGIILLSSFLFTLVTFIPHSFMYRLYVSGEIILHNGFISILVTYIYYSFMYCMYVC